MEYHELCENQKEKKIQIENMNKELQKWKQSTNTCLQIDNISNRERGQNSIDMQDLYTDTEQ